jgi:hypothetical protein
MNRRSFFRRIAGAVATAAVAPAVIEAAEPIGYRVFAGGVAGQWTMIDQATGAQVFPAIVDNFFKADPLLAYMKAKSNAPR